MPIAIKAGDLKHKVNIEINTPSTGDRGQPVADWTTLYAGVPAKIDDLVGKKLEIARQMVATATHQLTLRYLPGIGVDNRINFGGRIFNIGYIQNIQEQNFQLVITATEQQSGAK